MASELVDDTSDTGFQQDVLNSDVPVLVDFWATWCGPCKALSPHLDKLAEEYSGKAKIVKLDIENNPETPIKYGVRGVPALLVFKGGELVDRIQGKPRGQGPLNDLIARNL